MNADLRQWLIDIWGDAVVNRRSVPLNQIYGYYERTVDPEERTFTAGEHLDDIEFPAGDWTDPEVADNPLNMSGENTGAGYLYSFSPTHGAAPSTYRVVLHISPYNALIRAMRLVVRDIVKAGGKFVGVNGAKVMTVACFQSGRNDTLIIYVRDRRTALQVVNELRHWVIERIISPDCFVGQLPKTVNQVVAGIGYACEPPDTTILKSYTAKLSYGRFLSCLLYIAVDVALAAGSGRVNTANQFLTVAERVLAYAGIDANTPFEFGAMKAPFLASIPWACESAITCRSTPLYRTLVADMKWED